MTKEFTKHRSQTQGVLLCLPSHSPACDKQQCWPHPGPSPPRTCGCSLGGYEPAQVTGSQKASLGSHPRKELGIAWMPCVKSGKEDSGDDQRDYPHNSLISQKLTGECNWHLVTSSLLWIWVVRVFWFPLLILQTQPVLQWVCFWDFLLGRMRKMDSQNIQTGRTNCTEHLLYL